MNTPPTTCPICNHQPLSRDETSIFCSACSTYRHPLNLAQRHIAWAGSRSFWWRLPVYMWFLILLAQNIKDKSYAMNRALNPLSMLDFGIHELGHMLFMFFGEFMHILGGSLFQCLFPLMWLAAMVQKKWYFAAAMCWCWLGLNLFDVTTYIADARTRTLPLSVGPAAMGLDDAATDALYDQAHDWYQLLSRSGHLESDLAIATGLRIAAVIAFVTGLTIGGILLFHMLKGFLQRYYGTAK